MKSYESTVKQLHEALLDRDWMLGVAESCTGGLIGGAVTSVPGSSSVFRGGIIAYSNEAKKTKLRVPASDLEEHGAVSEPVSRSMAIGLVDEFDVDVGVSVTGVAGPSGGTETTPVGRVFFGLKTPGETSVIQRTFDGDRRAVRERTVSQALEFVLESI
jgi:PncC family amidohydrolase